MAGHGVINVCRRLATSCARFPGIGCVQTVWMAYDRVESHMTHMNFGPALLWLHCTRCIAAIRRRFTLWAVPLQPRLICTLHGAYTACKLRCAAICGQAWPKVWPGLRRMLFACQNERVFLAYLLPSSCCGALHAGLARAYSQQPTSVALHHRPRPALLQVLR